MKILMIEDEKLLARWAIAPVDNDSVATTFEPVDLSGLTADSLLPFEPLFFVGIPG